MSVVDIWEGGKGALEKVPKHFLVVGTIVLASSASFGLGILEGREMGRGGGIRIEQLATTTPEFLTAQAAAAVTAAAAAPATMPVGGEVVASKNGTKYYLPWCGTVKLIKEENKVWFASREAAETAGYQPAANCKGL